jgi:NIPSNAP protein
MRKASFAVLLCGLVGAAMAAALLSASSTAAETEGGKLYELRTYYVIEGRMPAMLKRFRDHTTKLFEKHGMENVGYWTPDGKEGETKLIYIVAHRGPEAAQKSWKGFRDDPVWQKVRDESEKDGKIVEKVESVYMKPTDFSKLK